MLSRAATAASRAMAATSYAQLIGLVSVLLLGGGALWPKTGGTLRSGHQAALLADTTAAGVAVVYDGLEPKNAELVSLQVVHRRVVLCPRPLPGRVQLF